MPVLRQVLCLDCMKKTQVILRAQRLVLLCLLFICLWLHVFSNSLILHFFSFFSLFFFFLILFNFFFFCFCFFFTFLIFNLHIGWAPVELCYSTDILVGMSTDISVEGCTKYTWSDFFASKLLYNLLVLPGPGKSVKCKRKETSDRNHSTGKRRTSRWSFVLLISTWKKAASIWKAVLNMCQSSCMKLARKKCTDLRVSNFTHLWAMQYHSCQVIVLYKSC